MSSRPSHRTHTLRTLLRLAAGILLTLGAIASAPAAARASTCPALTYGAAPTAGTWNGPETDCHTFNGTSGHTVAIAVDTLATQAPVKRVIAPDGSTTCQTGAWGPVNCTLPVTGTYRLETFYRPADALDHAYTLAIQDLTAPQNCARATVLGPSGLANTTVERRKSNDPVACLEFTVENPGRVRAYLATEPAGSAGPQVTLRTPDGTTCSPSSACLANAVGRYLVLIAGPAGRTTLTVQDWLPAGCTRLVSSGTTVTTTGTQRACAIVTANRGEDILGASSVTAAQPAGKRIVRPDGTTLCSSGSWAPLRCTIDQTGRNVFITWWRPVPTDPTERHDLTPLVLNATRAATTTASLQGIGAPETDSFGTWTGERTTLSALPLLRSATALPTRPAILTREASGTTIDVYDAAGRPACVNASEPCTIPAGARYSVWVSGRGTFRVHLLPTPPSTCPATTSTTPLELGGAPRSGEWIGAQRSCSGVVARAGHELELAITAPGATQAPAKRLLDAAGNELCRTGAWSPLRCTVPATGAYWVESSARPEPADGTARPHAVAAQDLTDPRQCATLTEAQPASGVRRGTDERTTCLQFSTPTAARLELVPGTTTIRVVDPTGAPACTSTNSCPIPGVSDPSSRYTVLISGGRGPWGVTLRPQTITRTPGSTEVASGRLSDPHLAVGPGGDAALIWIAPQSTGSRVLAAVRRPGGSWSAARQLSLAGGSVRRPQVAVDAAGAITAAWSRDAGGGVRTVETATLQASATTWDATTILEATGVGSAPTQLAVTRNGRAVIAWQGAAGARIATRATPASAWSTAEPVTGLVPAPSSVAIDDAGDIIVASPDLWGPAQAAVRQAGSPSWTTEQIGPPNAGDGVFGGVKVVMAPGGSAIATWTVIGGCADCLITQAQAATWTPAAGWSQGTALGNSGYADPPAIAASADGAATVAWSSQTGIFGTGAPFDVRSTTMSADGTLAAPQLASAAPRVFVGRRALARDDAGRSLLVQQTRSTSDADANAVVLSALAPGAATWSAPVDLMRGGPLANDADGTLGPQVAATSAANAWAAWVELDADGVTRRLRAAPVPAGAP